jgi:hypothetical protein
MDIIGFHGYGATGAGEQILSQLQTVRQVAASHGYSNVPIWNTEGSWGQSINPTTDTLAWQANFLAREYILSASAGIARYIWYGWDYNARWGTLWNNGTLPAGQAYGTVYNWLVGATFTTPCAKINGSAWRCELSRPGGYSAQILWTDDDSNQNYQVSGSFVRRRDLITNSASPIPRRHGIHWSSTHFDREQLRGMSRPLLK